MTNHVADHVLTTSETAYIHGMYACAKPVNIGTWDKPIYKIELNQLKYITDDKACMLCCWYDPEPFVRTMPADWKVIREGLEIRITCSKKGQYYIIDTDNGDVHVLRSGMRCHLGTSAYGFQFLMRHNFAFPLKFEKGHWANGKNALQIGIAVPDQAPLNRALLQHLGSIELLNEWRFNKKLLNVDLYDVDTYNKELDAIIDLMN